MSLESPSCAKATLDEELECRIKLYLAARHSALRLVAVAVNHGMVHISGAVESFYLRQLAIAVASRVAGVRQIIDDIEVCVPPPQLREQLTCPP